MAPGNTMDGRAQKMDKWHQWQVWKKWPGPFYQLGFSLPTPTMAGKTVP